MAEMKMPGGAPDKPHFRVGFNKAELQDLYASNPTGFHEWMAKIMRKLGETLTKVATSAPATAASLTECWPGYSWLQRIDGVWYVVSEIWCQVGGGAPYMDHLEYEPA